MFRAAIRSTPRALRQPAARTAVASTGRRWAGTAPADKRQTWKGTAARWGLAIGALYWYNTSSVFADEVPSRLSAEPPQFSEADLKTVDAIVEEKRKQLDAELKERQGQEVVTAKESRTQQTTATEKDGASTVAAPEDAEKSPEQLEEEAGQQGAFNPETGEINWDCPCLGGMAHGPCGEEFKAAFSCFVYSNEEPKGMDCVDKFQHMQDCFRKYPEIYGAEIADEDAAEAEAEAAAAGSPAPGAQSKDDATAPTASSKAADEVAETPRQTQNYRTEEHKAAATDAPKSASPAVDPAAGDKRLGEENVQGPKEGLEDKERGVPVRSFDATSSATKGDS